MGGPQFTLVDSRLSNSSRRRNEPPRENSGATASAIAPPRGRRTSALFTRFGGFSFARSARRDNARMTTLYLQMTEKLSAHWRANNNAYPQKFVLSPALRDTYLGDLRLLNNNVGKTVTMPAKHMGVTIEVDEASPGVMVAADGTEVALQ